VIGLWQGWWVAYVGVPGFIATLAGMMFFRGLNQYIGKSNSVPAPEQIQWPGGGYLPEWGPNTGLNNSTLLLGIIAIAYVIWREFQLRRRAQRIGDQPNSALVVGMRVTVLVAVIVYVTYLYGTGRPGTSFPVPGVLLVLLIIGYHILT